MRILVVDDEAQMRKVLRLMLEGTGYEVLDAENGKKALNLQETTPVDLIITDIIMPEMEGIEFIMKVRKITPHVKIIAISGDCKVDPDLSLGIAGQLGANRTLLKPVSKSVLMSVIGELFPESNC